MEENYSKNWFLMTLNVRCWCYLAAWRWSIKLISGKGNKYLAVLTKEFSIFIDILY